MAVMRAWLAPRCVVLHCIDVCMHGSVRRRSIYTRMWCGGFSKGEGERDESRRTCPYRVFFFGSVEERQKKIEEEKHVSGLAGMEWREPSVSPCWRRRTSCVDKTVKARGWGENGK